MKIGILTWYFAYNYGARAHSLSLYNVLSEMGHDVEMINFPTEGSFKRALRTCAMIENRKRHPIIIVRGLRKKIKFDRHKKIYRTSRVVHTAEEIDSLGYDIVICGSDEIINLKHKSYNDIYYGVGIKTPKMMYAVSAGVVEPDTVLSPEIKESLNEMRGISVRDITTLQLIENNISKKPLLVLDPTLLYDFPKTSCRHKEPYVLVYSFGPLNEYGERIREYASKNGLKIYSVGRYCKWTDKNYITADLNEWLELYEHASMIVTDSYHGLIFAMKNRKDYVLIRRSDKVNKTDGLMEYLGVGRTYYDKNFSVSEYLKNKVDYDSLFENIEAKKKDSLEYLKNTIEGVAVK